MRVAVVLVLTLIVAVAIPVLVNRWADRRDREVDDYHDREFRDPPTIGGTWPGGGGGFG